MGTQDMPSFNWSRLRPIAHSIASTIRHAQASAYQLHRDFETIREENRRYAAAHYGTAPHWDGYGPDGRRTGNGSGSGNGNRSRSGSRNGNRSGNSDRQRQRDRSFERSHPWMSRALYYAMPHLGGYETGRGFTWNAQGERWGDSFRRGAEYLSNIRRRTAEARAYRSSATAGWGTPSGGMPLPNPGAPTPTPVPIPNSGGTAGGGWGQWGAPTPAPAPTPTPAPRTRGAGGASPIPTPSPAPNRGSGESDPDYSVPIPNPGSGWRWEQWESGGTDNGSSATGSTGNRRAPDPTPAPSPNPTPTPSTAQSSSQQQRQENTYDRTFNGGQWWNRGQSQSPDSTTADASSNQAGNGTTSQKSQSTDYIFPFGGKTMDEVLAEERAQRERYNREVENTMRGQTRQSHSTDYVFPFDGRTLDEVAAESTAERERKNREVEMKMHGRTQPDLFEEMERQNKAAIDDWNRRLNKYRSDIDEQYGEFKREADRMMTDSFLPKRTRLALSHDISMMEQRYKRYVRGKYDTDLDGKKAFSEQIANVLEGKFPSYQAAINNMVYEYGEYQNQILLASFYGVNDIPNMSMREYTEWKDDSDFDKYDPLAVQRLIDDLRAGKETTYEQEVKDARERSDELRRRRLEVPLHLIGARDATTFRVQSIRLSWRCATRRRPFRHSRRTRGRVSGRFAGRYRNTYRRTCRPPSR